MFYTYAHTLQDGTIFYIGKGKAKRAWDKSQRGKYWKFKVAKHPDYLVEILANWNTEEEAFSHERLLISSLKDIGIKLVNLTDGGEGFCGGRHTSESKNKISKANKGMFGANGEKHPQFGKTGLSCANTKYYLIATNIDTGAETVLCGIKEIKAAGFNWGNIAHCLSGKRTKHHGHTFKRILTCQ